MSQETLRVVPYSISNLVQELARVSTARVDTVQNRVHRVFFEEYFGKLGAQTMVIEEPYVDRAYLEDYASYYVKCFQQYKSTCARLHFFTCSFRQADLTRHLRGNTTRSFRDKFTNENYLGFIVVKPLPLTIVGRTCLRTYPADAANGRMYPATRAYKAHLAGCTFEVDTLPFQEQDQVVAACATSSLWTAFNATGRTFHHSIPSPYEITNAALAYADEPSRAFPHKQGLKGAEMAAAIRSVTLEPLMIGYTDVDTFKAAIYSYLRGRVPLMLLKQLVDIRPIPNRQNALGQITGAHASTVTGFSLADPPATTSMGPVLRSSRIDQIYVHDDQVGPFARMKFMAATQPVQVQGGAVSAQLDVLTTSYGITAGPNSFVAAPFALLVPLYNKIRIPFLVPIEAAAEFDEIINLLRPVFGLPINGPFEWDIFLSGTNYAKKELLASGLKGPELEKMLKMHLPRFLWQATAYDGDTRTLDLFFDATDVEQGRLLLSVVVHNPSLAAALKNAFSAAGLRGMNSNKPGAQAIFDWLCS